tara:strand:+ start:2098 stop:2982 length:885 start_codon:yes stop_codon:yes gene_type:complete
MLLILILILLLLYILCNKSILCIIIFFIVIQYLIINTNPYKNFDSDKMSILNYISDKYKPKSEYFNINTNYKFPYILKPTVCSRTSKDVSLISNKQELKDYLKDYLKNNNNFNELMYQEFIDTDYEIGISYERNPLNSDGKIISIVHRTFLGGKNFNPMDIKYYIGEKRKSYMVNRSDLINNKLNKIIDTISKSIPNFYVGRFDIRVKKLSDLDKGHFFILEANGTMGFDLRKDINFYLNPYSIYIKIRFILIRIFYGFLNIFKLNIVNPRIIVRSYYNAFKCKDWEKIFAVYT